MPHQLPEVPGVLLAGGSSGQRRLLRGFVEAAGWPVAGEARGDREALALVGRLRPAVVLLDLGTGLAGLDVVEQVMAGCPTPIVALAEDPAGEQALAARAAGAVDVLARPRPGTAGDLAARLRVAARVRVIRHPRGRLPRPRPPAADPVLPGPQLVAIGASTGGPLALGTVLAGLPADFRPAVLVVQHMGADFLAGLVGWLDARCALPVSLGVPGRRLRAGTVTVAAGGVNSVVHANLRVALCAPPAGQFHVPGIDVAFASAAAAYGPEAVGVLLTGMGRDGAVGLKAMRDRGATTLAQDAATSAVFGMPAAAAELGAVQHQLPLGEVAPFLVALAGCTAAVP